MQDLGSKTANQSEQETPQEICTKALEVLRQISHTTTSDTLHFNTLIATQLLEQIIKEMR